MWQIIRVKKWKKVKKEKWMKNERRKMSARMPFLEENHLYAGQLRMKHKK